MDDPHGYEAMLIALQLVDRWNDPDTRHLIASATPGNELVRGLVLLALTLRVNLANQVGCTEERINWAVRDRTLQLLADG